MPKSTSEVYVERLEEFIRAVITDADSLAIEDSVRLSEVRKAFIQYLDNLVRE